MSSQSPATTRHDAAALRTMARAMFERVGMPAERAADVADILVEGDLMGHDTHGLQLLPTYLAEIESGSMALKEDYDVLANRAAVATWDGKRLPGPWLTLRAMECAMARARDYGTGTVTIRRAHHIACLAAYLERATRAGFVMLLYSSAPAAKSVAPFGGTRPVFSPSPMAVGFPTPQGPVLIDVSTSITTVGLTTRLYKEGKRLPHQWLIDEHGNASDDPAVLFPPHAGSILPLGGLDAGHKGYALSLMVEALTAGLAGHGRDDPGKNWGNTVFLQILDPSAFAGEEAFAGQMGWIAWACTDNPPRPGMDRVRLPGQGALERKARQLRDGVALNPAILPQLQPWLEKFGMQAPAPLA
ncbi:Ldh family oxidoreductase [Cupriavidus basilensis]|uniref:Ldh family oxidoreductase n=1 Tax=Cupriavidus basilensis TaxID=68895 RepID=A0ABT6APP6_9BURK|nr:Ldh family oxidoreductase [Cupriavidus basilensis]MDF3834267.1 Ldh family oxidoreductase [Cupriavidus basilensis]